ncbi:STAS/SEC14 domain-containing protein [Jannaschia sp. 2305UL9-9]|uniref:STAS/SEC14 domain-containing protein n=1 Tax=Jannaschia sp. 2305UL9-9 TaxID=3121638 RepID=UPI003527AE90
MTRIEEIAPRVHEITLAGVVEKADVEAMERELTPLLEGDGKISLVIRAEEWSDITADALAEDLRFELKMLPKLTKVARVALVTSKQGLAALVRWIDPVVPMVEMRAFAAGDVQAARDWAADAPALNAAPSGPGLTILEDGTGGVLAYEVDGRVTKADADTVFDALERATAGDRKIDLMVVVKDWDGFQLSVLNREFMGGKFAAVGKVRRYAVVGAPSWMAMAAQAMDPALPIDIRTFDLAARDEAREWLAS